MVVGQYLTQNATDAHELFEMLHEIKIQMGINPQVLVADNGYMNDNVLKYAYEKGYHYAIQFDADGQHRPEFIQAMLDRVKEGYDIVIGSRFLTQKKGRSLRMVGSKMITVAIKLTTGVRVSDSTSGMRLFSRDMIREFAQNLNYGPEPDTISYLLKNGAKVSEVQVKMEERQFGESYLNFMESAKYMIKMLTSILFVQNFRKRG